MAKWCGSHLPLTLTLSCTASAACRAMQDIECDASLPVLPDGETKSSQFFQKVAQSITTAVSTKMFSFSI